MTNDVAEVTFLMPMINLGCLWFKRLEPRRSIAFGRWFTFSFRESFFFISFFASALAFRLTLSFATAFRLALIFSFS
jgi:hypothetical protein